MSKIPPNRRKGTSASTRAIARRLKVPLAEPETPEDECTCFEAHGEDPKCVFHGTATQWALENTTPENWQSQVLEQAQIIADLECKADAAISVMEAQLLVRTPTADSDVLREALEPVLHWYQSDEHPERPLLDIVADVVADLQHDRTEALQCAQMRAALQKIADAPAWGYPDRWETTPAEVRQLARAALSSTAPMGEG